MKNTKENARVEYLDFLKAVSILLVVFCHQCFLSDDSIVGNLIMCAAWAGVPCFFLVSGALLHAVESWSWKRYFKKLLTLCLVVLAWKVIALLTYRPFVEPNYGVAELLRYLFGTQTDANIDYNIVWFMYAYVMAYLFYPVSWFLYHAGRRGKQILFFFLAVIWIGKYCAAALNNTIAVIMNRSGREPFTIETGDLFPFGHYGGMLFFVLLGMFLYGERERIDHFLREKKLERWLPAALTVGGICAMWIVKYIENGTWAWMGIYISDGYTRMAVIVLAVGMYLLAKQLPQTRVTGWIARGIGRHTQGVFYMHYLVMTIPLLKYRDILQPHYSLGLNLLKTVIVTAICLIITMAVKRIPLLRHLMG